MEIIYEVGLWGLPGGLEVDSAPGRLLAWDSSADVYYRLTRAHDGTLRYIHVEGGTARLSATEPFTWAAGDRIVRVATSTQ